MKKHTARPLPSTQPLQPIADAALRDVTGGTDRDVATGQSSGKRQHEPIRF